MAHATDAPPAQPWAKAMDLDRFTPADVERLLREHHDRADQRAKHWRIFLGLLPFIWALAYAVLYAAIRSARS